MWRPPVNMFSTAVKATILAASVLSTSLVAAAWPDRPIRLVVPFPAGGSYDVIARMLSLKLEKRLGQAVTVENITGGATVPGVLSVLKAKADGYSLLLASDGTFNINPHTVKGLPYNPDAELTPVTILNTVPHWIITSAGNRHSNFTDLTSYIRNNPGKASISINTVAGAAHLGLANWKQQNKLDFAIIPYRGSPPAMLDLIGGQTDAHVDVVGSSVSYVSGGKAKPLGVLQTTAVELFPNLEKQKEQDKGALLVRANLALAVKAGTPQAIIDRLYQEVKSSAQEPDFLARLQSLAYEPVLTTPSEARDFLHAETARYGAIVKSINFQAQ